MKVQTACCDFINEGGHTCPHASGTLTQGWPSDTVMAEPVQGWELGWKTTSGSPWSPLWELLSGQLNTVDFHTIGELEGLKR